MGERLRWRGCSGEAALERLLWRNCSSPLSDHALSSLIASFISSLRSWSRRLPEHPSAAATFFKMAFASSGEIILVRRAQLMIPSDSNRGMT